VERCKHPPHLFIVSETVGKWAYGVLPIVVAKSLAGMAWERHTVVKFASEVTNNREGAS
jgi:hypothetical protein